MGRGVGERVNLRVSAQPTVWCSRNMAGHGSRVSGGVRTLSTNQALQHAFLHDASGDRVVGCNPMMNTRSSGAARPAERCRAGRWR